MNVFLHPSPRFKKYYMGAFLLALLALGVTVLLIQAHYQTAEVGSYCNINDYWNCDRVNKSSFAEILGIPVSILGFLYYLFVAAVYFLVLRGFNFSKKLLPITPRFLLISLSAIGVISSAVLGVIEFDILKAWSAVAVIKAFVFIVLFITIYKYASVKKHPESEFLGFLTALSLFGVNFSLYLTGIELFVLQAFCIFCLTQQIIILIIAVINFIVLKKSNHEHTLHAGS